MADPFQMFKNVLGDVLDLEEKRDQLKEDYEREGASYEESLQRLKVEIVPRIKDLENEIKMKRRELVELWMKHPQAFEDIREGRSIKFEDLIVTFRLAKNYEPVSGKEFDLIKALHDAGWLEQSIKIELDEKVIEKLLQNGFIDPSLVHVEDVIIPAIRKNVSRS